LDPKLRDDIIPSDSEFVLFDDEKKDRIIGLCSSKGRQIASEGKICFMDGTFKSSN